MVPQPIVTNEAGQGDLSVFIGPTGVRSLEEFNDHFVVTL